MRIRLFPRVTVIQTLVNVLVSKNEVFSFKQLSGDSFTSVYTVIKVFIATMFYKFRQQVYNITSSLIKKCLLLLFSEYMRQINKLEPTKII